jgi:tRNA (guanine-N7-)-methyltransferase
MVSENKFDVIADAEDLYSPDFIDKYDAAQALQTHYERQWLDRGLTIKYLAWHLPQTQSFIEPDIEIEKDTYRSYGRNYVSPTNN